MRETQTEKHESQTLSESQTESSWKAGLMRNEIGVCMKLSVRVFYRVLALQAAPMAGGLFAHPGKCQDCRFSLFWCFYQSISIYLFVCF